MPYLFNTSSNADAELGGLLRRLDQRANGTYTALRVLVVEDSPTIRDLEVVMLCHAGHDATGVDSGSAALARLEVATFDVVVADLALGGGVMDGLQLARVVCERWPGVGFILATGWADEVPPARLEEACVDAVLTKPFRGALLRDAVLRVGTGHAWQAAS